MTVTVKNIIPAMQIGATQADLYTAVACKTIIDKCTVTNTSASNVTISVNLIPLAGVAGNGNLIIKARAIAPNETYNCPELVGQVIEPGGIFSTLAGVATSLTVAVSGREIT